MILKKLKIVDFKCVQSVELELSDVNILVGVNGSGKSSIIQAIHLACCMIRQADSIQSNKTSTVGIEELDYLPTNNYKMLGHNTMWGNNKDTPSSKIDLNFLNDDEEKNASCELRSARNAGISITGDIPRELIHLLRKKNNFFSAYIPGISGIPNKEERRGEKVILKACSYGDSNVILRNVLLLLRDRDQQNINKMEEWIQSIIGPFEILINYDDEKDLTIKCEINLDSISRPLELIGTGYLQLIQIFSYILLFEPGILLIDEPDIHLHPTVQEKLVQILLQVANEKNIKILMTTHSPFILRGAPISTNVYWIEQGRIQSEDRGQVELALGWGAFGKKIIIISEDANTIFLRKIIAQWPELDKFIAFYPGTGYKSLPKPDQAKAIKNALGNKYEIIIHRDRDSLTDNEIVTITSFYQNEGIHIWFTELSDIESYFCKEDFLSNSLGLSNIDISDSINEILTSNTSPIREQFNKQRKAINEELHASGGSPTNDDIWNLFQARYLRGAKGKFILGRLKEHKKTNNLQRLINNLVIGKEVEVASDLKQFLEQILGS
jgi:AAA15 family ATPase/GTPase